MLEKQAKLTAKALIIDEAVILQHWQDYALALEKESTKKVVATTKVILDQATQSKCIAFLKSDNLITRINEAIGKTGVVGEAENRLLLLLIATSYHSKNPLHGLIQGRVEAEKQNSYKVFTN